MTRRCEDLEGLLSVLETGELDELEADEVRVHLEVCEACRDTLAAYQELSRVCAEEPAPELSEEVSERVLGRLRAELTASPSMPGALAGASAPAPEVMTVEEAARFMRVTLEEMESELRELPCFEFAGKLRIRRSALVAWIEERERRSRSRRWLSVVEG